MFIFPKKIKNKKENHVKFLNFDNKSLQINLELKNIIVSLIR